jgi:hypothetical protein
MGRRVVRVSTLFNHDIQSGNPPSPPLPVEYLPCNSLRPTIFNLETLHLLLYLENTYLTTLSNSLYSIWKPSISTSTQIPTFELSWYTPHTSLYPWALSHFPDDFFIGFVVLGGVGLRLVWAVLPRLGLNKRAFEAHSTRCINATRNKVHIKRRKLWGLHAWQSRKRGERGWRQRKGQFQFPGHLPEYKNCQGHQP